MTLPTAFASLDEKVLPKWGILFKQKKLLLNFILEELSPTVKGGKNKHDIAASPESGPIP